MKKLNGFWVVWEQGSWKRKLGKQDGGFLPGVKGRIRRDEERGRQDRTASDGGGKEG